MLLTLYQEGEPLLRELCELVARDPHVDRYHEVLDEKFGTSLDAFKEELDQDERDRWNRGESIPARRVAPQGQRSPWLLEKLARLGVK